MGPRTRPLIRVTKNDGTDALAHWDGDCDRWGDVHEAPNESGCFCFSLVYKIIDQTSLHLAFAATVARAYTLSFIVGIARPRHQS